MTLYKARLFLIAGLILVFVVQVSADLETNPDIPDSISYSSHDYLEITSDVQLRSIANSEGWRGDGSPGNPFIIENYRFSGGTLNPQTAVDIKSNMGYTEDQFRRFSIIITNIESYVIIRYNEISDSVLLNTIDNYNGEVIFEGNLWQSKTKPNNLITYGDGFTVRHNTFYGSGLGCDSKTSFTRYIAQGSKTTIEENIFEVDDGCGTTQNIELRDIGENPYYPNASSGYTKPVYIITGNYFKSNDLAINVKTHNVDINLNDFVVGKLGILTNGKTVSIHSNNFYVSDIDVVGVHRYYSNNYDFIDTGVEGNRSKAQYNPEIRPNYYSDWTTPDKNRDSIVDVPYNHGLSAQNESRFIVDLEPSVDPFSTHFHPITPGGFNITLLTIIGSIYFSSMFAIYYYYSFYNGPGHFTGKMIPNKTIFGREIPDSAKDTVKELFKSQSVLYYSIIGQSKIPDKDIENEIKKAIPKRIYDYKFLLHPIRLTMIKLLYENLEMNSVELKELMEISWNDYLNHSKSMKKNGYIRIDDGFVDGNKRSILRIEPKGVEEFKALTDLLQLVLDNTSDLTTYIQVVQGKLKGTDQYLYPSD